MNPVEPMNGWWKNGGADRDRTCDLLIANETLYQLSYDPNLPAASECAARLICCFSPPRQVFLPTKKRIQHTRFFAGSARTVFQSEKRSARSHGAELT